jgi:cytochrome c oxidase subunit 3
MSSTILEGPRTPSLLSSNTHRHDGRGAAVSIGIWVLIGVASSLFFLFLWAYVMRMDGADWSPVAMPPQLWISTALLAAGSATLHFATAAAQAGHWERTRRLLAAGGASALLFLVAQLWAWHALLDARVTLSGNPAGSFFYLLTAMHGLHVAAGLAGWVVALRGMHLHRTDAAGSALRIRLCARYWHFLLAVWGVLFLALGWLTPEVVRYICGTD